MTRARGSHFFRSADVTFYEIRRWRDREREREGGDFVTSNEERAVLSKLIIGRHWRRFILSPPKNMLLRVLIEVRTCKSRLLPSLPGAGGECRHYA